MSILDVLTDDQRMKNIISGIISMLLLIGVLLLGFDASHWTSNQIQQYCNVEWCKVAKINGYYGANPDSSFNVSAFNLTSK